jgi:hypothetical protein
MPRESKGTTPLIKVGNDGITTVTVVNRAEENQV